MFRDSFRRFLDKEIVPRTEEFERDGIMDRALFAKAGEAGFLGMEVPEEYGGGGVKDFRYNTVIIEECAETCHRRQRPRHHAPQRHLPAVLPPPVQRGAEAALAARHLLRRADHGRGHDRAGHRLRPRLDDHHRHPGRRRLHRQRLQDVHHQRHQRRPRDHSGEDRSDPEAQGHVAHDHRARHGGLRAGPQPGEDRPPLPGHRGAVLHRRAGAGREPARSSRGRGLPLPRHEPAPGAAVHRRGRPRRPPGRPTAGRWST